MNHAIIMPTLTLSYSHIAIDYHYYLACILSSLLGRMEPMYVYESRCYGAHSDLSYSHTAIDCHYYLACILFSFSDLTVAIAAGLATYKFGLVSVVTSFFPERVISKFSCSHPFCLSLSLSLYMYASP